MNSTCTKVEKFIKVSELYTEILKFLKNADTNIHDSNSYYHE